MGFYGDRQQKMLPNVRENNNQTDQIDQNWPKQIHHSKVAVGLLGCWTFGLLAVVGDRSLVSLVNVSAAANPMSSNNSGTLSKCHDFHCWQPFLTKSLKPLYQLTLFFFHLFYIFLFFFFFFCTIAAIKHKFMEALVKFAVKIYEFMSSCLKQRVTKIKKNIWRKRFYGL